MITLLTLTINFLEIAVKNTDRNPTYSKLNIIIHSTNYFNK